METMETKKVAEEAIGKILIDAQTQNHLPQFFTYEGIRPEYQDLIGQIVEAKQVSADMVFSFMIGTMSIVIGGKYATKYSSYAPVRGNLAVAVVAPSGAGKSTVFEGLTELLKQIQASRKKSHERQLEEYIKNKESGPKPVYRRIFFQDATWEVASSALVAQPEGVGFLNDENLIDFCGAYKDKAGAMSDTRKLINALDGNSLSRDRQGTGESLYSPHVYLSICGCTQPSDIGALLGEWQIKKGLAARFLFCCADNCKGEEQESPTPIDYSYWEAAIKGRTMPMPSEVQLPLLRPLNPDAFSVIKEYRNRKRKEEIEYEKQGRIFLQTMCGKQQVIVLRLALVLHFLSPYMAEEQINGQEAEYAVRCMDVFESHALRVEQLAAAQPGARKEISRYGIIHQAWDMLVKWSEEKGVPMPSQAEFARIFGIPRQNFNQKVLTAKY